MLVLTISTLKNTFRKKSTQDIQDPKAEWSPNLHPAPSWGYFELAEARGETPAWNGWQQMGMPARNQKHQQNFRRIEK